MGVDFLANVVVVDLSPIVGDQRTDDELACLGELHEVRWLNLASDRVTDAGLKHFGGLSHLRMLCLRGNRITGYGIRKRTLLASS